VNGLPNMDWSGPPVNKAQATPRFASHHHHMTRGVKIGVWVAIGIVVAAIAIYGQGWYFDRYTWPRKIQREILGKVVVEHGALLTYAGFSHFGQGGFRWTYRVEPTNPTIAEYCGI
jgi:hypothetical protein